jgi:2-haloacid dehalogenase
MIFVFDAYGTLFDVNGAARKAANEPEMIAINDSWQSIASGWRERQLRYSWLYSMMDRYEDFWVLTERALDDTIKEHKLSGDRAIRTRLLDLYGELPPFDEARTVLSRLRELDHPTAVFSNASPKMLEKALIASGLQPLFDEIISVDALKKYKPTPEVYGLVIQQFKCSPHDITFFSSNNWDISGANSFGFKTVWVNRMGLPWDSLPGAPDLTANSLLDALFRLGFKV